jgi:hypothetical protein
MATALLDNEGVHTTVYDALESPATQWAEVLPEFARSWHPTWEGTKTERAGEMFSDEGAWSIGLDGYFVRLTRARD